MVTLFNSNTDVMAKRVCLQAFAMAIALLLALFNTSVLASSQLLVQESTGALSANSAEAENEQRRALMEKAILAEKYKINTEARDRENRQREQGRVFGFDLVLGAFLTMLWAIISLFIAAQFLPEKQRLENKANQIKHNKIGARIFYASAALVPIMLLWVSIATGYVSWWLAFVISGLIYGSFSRVFQWIERNRMQPAR
jgi:predicted PurR-regulated permease PerM